MLAEKMQRLAAVMARLREEGGCPWDRAQDHKTLKPYLIEEAYEVLEAIDEDRPDKLREELGDLLLQVVFHARIEEEAGRFDLADVAEEIADKLIRRHPHVFAELRVDGVDGVLANWDKIKRHEYGGERPSALSGVPEALPALARAEKIQAKAAKVGFDWEDADGPMGKVEEEWREFREELAAVKSGGAERTRARLAEELGDMLFALVNVARFLEIDAEDALRRTTRKFARRFARIEEAAAASGRRLEGMSLAEMDLLWDEAKRSE
ncbi:MAG: nucleoside triphosphate pyrophosphohydrolase [Patescibacteria group bacterium]